MKKMPASELVAVAATVLGIGGAVVWPFVHEDRAVQNHFAPNAQVVTITGVAAAGIWTDEEVRGGNYFAKEFRPARPILRQGEPTLLRLKSADVVHEFYCPELGIGPIEVYPGHVVELEVVPTKAGAFDYYCMKYCGKPHFMMRGQIVVQPPLDLIENGDDYWLEPPPQSTRLVDRGAWLFRQNGCFACHGEHGQGGVSNPNYVKDTVPALDTLAERMFLFYQEDVDAVVGILERRLPLEQLTDDPPVPRWSAVVAQYQSIRDLLEHGNPAGKRDPQGPMPPLSMPTWGQRLTDSDIDALIAYLLTLKPTG